MSHPTQDPRQVQVLGQQLKLLTEDIERLEKMADGQQLNVSFFQTVLNTEAKTEALLAQIRAIRQAVR